MLTPLSHPRKSGLSCTDCLPWGTHVCVFYDQKKDLSEALVSYFREGLLQNEMCLWVTSDDFTHEEALAALHQAIPSFQSFLDSGQFLLLSSARWYGSPESLDLQKILRQWEEKVTETLRQGYEGLRCCGFAPQQIQPSVWAGILDYERSINNLIPDLRIMAVCCYDLKCFSAMEVMDVVQAHHVSLVVKNGQWSQLGSTAEKITKPLTLPSTAEIDSYKNLFQSLPTSLMVLDSCGLVRFVNPAIDRFFGPEAHRKMVGQNLNHLITEKNGSVLHLYPEPQKKIQAQLFIEPIRWLNERAHLITLLEIPSSPMVTAMVSHELKTPLGAIKAALELVLDEVDGPVTPDQRETLGVALSSMDRLVRLIRNVLDVSKMENGEVRAHFETHDLTQIVHEATELMSRSMAHKKINFEVSVPHGAILADCDSDKIKQVLINILDNAQKFTPDGQSVSLKLRTHGSQAVIEITDTGMGIHPDDHQKIFELYGQSRTGHRTTSGFGVGLAVCKKMIELHSGHIELVSEIGQGTTFQISFPLKKIPQSTSIC